MFYLEIRKKFEENDRRSYRYVGGVSSGVSFVSFMKKCEEGGFGWS